MTTQGFVAGALLFLAILAVVLLLGGCTAPSQHAAINQAALANRAGVQAADQMLLAHKIGVVEAQAVYDSGVAVRKSLGTWENAVIASESSILPTKGAAVKTTSSAASADLQALLVAMNNLPAPSSHEGRKFLAPLRPITEPSYSGQKKITPAAVVAIIQLASDLAPTVVSLVNGVFNRETVTAQVVAATFAGLDVDLAKLKADITVFSGR